jgi:hypothetical protein
VVGSYAVCTLGSGIRDNSGRPVGTFELIELEEIDLVS